MVEVSALWNGEGGPRLRSLRTVAPHDVHQDETLVLDGERIEALKEHVAVLFAHSYLVE